MSILQGGRFGVAVTKYQGDENLSRMKKRSEIYEEALQFIVRNDECITFLNNCSGRDLKCKYTLHNFA